MEKLWNNEYHRWEVYPENPVVRNGEEQPVYVSADSDSCDAYLKTVDKKAQQAKILNFIKEYGSIVREQAVRIGVLELSARICEMRNDGIRIKDEVVKVYDSNGKYLYYKKRYYI